MTAEEHPSAFDKLYELLNAIDPLLVKLRETAVKLAEKKDPSDGN